MAQTTTPRQQGDDYQARFFWLQACRLFDDYSKVAKVGYDVSDIKSFDDVVVYYHTPLIDERGDPVSTDYYQVKFHVDLSGAFTWEALMDPQFIGASSFSLLQRLQIAQNKFAPQGKGARFYIVAPWTIHPNDPLGKLVSNSGNQLRLTVLFDGSGPGSIMGKIRTAWRDHLQLTSDDELRQVLSPLRIKSNSEDMVSLGERLNSKLEMAGMVPVENGSRIFPYDDLIRKIRAAGQSEFTAAEIEKICQDEHLWRGKPAVERRATSIGVRSFIHWAEYLEDQTEAMLPLDAHFDNRRIREPRLWNEVVTPKIVDFLGTNVRSGRPYRLHLDTHTSVAFAAGYCLDPKSGVDIAIVQSTMSGKVLYHHDAVVATSDYPGWSYLEETRQHTTGNDVAIALCVTYPILQDVREYVEHNVPSVRRIISLTILPQPSQSSVRDGTHALVLAQAAASMLKEKRTIPERMGVLHIFASAPNSLVFSLGRFARSFGCCQLYEYEFEANTCGAYTPSIALPPPNH
jgi:hypothetical protein